MHQENTSDHPPKEDSNKPVRLHWRERKKIVARRKQLAEQVAARRPALIDRYVQALGGRDAITALQLADVERVADLQLLADDMRSQVRQAGGARLRELMSLEGLIMRSIKALNLPPPGRAAAAAAAPSTGLHDIVARHTATAGDG